eukprot:6190368-Pleurochrysis_carterae.AAC.2
MPAWVANMPFLQGVINAVGLDTSEFKCNVTLYTQAFCGQRLLGTVLSDERVTRRLLSDLSNDLERRPSVRVSKLPGTSPNISFLLNFSEPVLLTNGSRLQFVASVVPV